MSEQMPVRGHAGTYRALIVDDERLARVALRAMLTAHPELEVVGEAASGTQAAAAIKGLAPHLVFLDIEMPELDGFRVLAELAPYDRPVVVFVTAHRQFALEAFGVSAVDYVLKPVSRQRLASAVRRALRMLRGEALESGGGQAMERAAREGPRTGRLAVRDRDRLVFVDPADVRWFEVYGNYLRLAVGGRQLLLRTTLQAVAAKLDPDAFVRISRSLLVNLRYVQSVRHQEDGRFELTLAGGTVLTSSRRYRRDLRAVLQRS